MARFHADTYFRRAWEAGVNLPVSGFAAPVKLAAEQNLWEPAFLTSAMLVEAFHLRLVFGLFRKLRHNPTHVWAVLLNANIDVNAFSQVVKELLKEPYDRWLANTCGRNDAARAFATWRDGTRPMRNKVVHAVQRYSAEALCKATLTNVAYMRLSNEAVRNNKGFEPAGDLRRGLPRGGHLSSGQSELEFRRVGLVRPFQGFPPSPRQIAARRLKPKLEAVIRSAGML